jgi:hypothetical protein
MATASTRPSTTPTRRSKCSPPARAGESRCTLKHPDVLWPQGCPSPCCRWCCGWR